MSKNKRTCLLLTILMLFSNMMTINTPLKTKAADKNLQEAGNIYYFVKAGDPTPETIEEGEQLGLYNSKTEQKYGMDDKTGKKWGLVTETTAMSVVDEEAGKYSTLRYYNGPQKRDKAIEYKFELPKGTYDITLGFKNKWSGRSVNIHANEQNLSNGDYDIGEYGMEKEFAYRQLSIEAGELSLKIQGPENAELTNHNDPLVNYISITESVLLSLSNLEEKILEGRGKIAGENTYTDYSVQQLQKVIDQAEDLLNSIIDEGLEVEAREVQEDIHMAIQDLDTAIEGLELYKENKSFKPGQMWKDTDGKPIQAHGGGIMYDEKTATYYWYGEDKTNGYLPATGVHAYSSKDLYNWKDEGVVMKAIENREDMDTDPYFVELYKNRTTEEKDVIFSDINSARGVLERPKVIYNEKTDKYVLWLHVDGPYEGSDSNYAKAKAGVAVSDSPTGPFEYLESNRLNKMPDGYEFKVKNTGMARDMTLFVDDDGTAYIIYASEENYSLYISKLNEEYTAIAGEEYGKDFTRAIYDGHREAPAMFKYDGKYYLITSGATGWDPNPAKYHVAESVLGEWKDMGNPTIGEGAATTHGSQSTYVIPVDPEKGKFIYMGDRWKKEDLKNSSYVWLPLEFGQDDEMALEWFDEWDLTTLNKMGKVTIHTELPEKVSLGEIPNLPDTINITNSEGKQMDTSVTWEMNPEDFSNPGIVTVAGTLLELAEKVIRIKILVLPNNVQYFVHAGGAETEDYKLWTSYMQETLVNKDRIDQQYDPENGQSWGYIGDRTSPAGSEDGDLFSALRYLTPNSGTDLSYKFNLDNDKYTVYLGLYDPWYSSTKGSRKADILFNGEVHTKDYVFTDAYDVVGGEVEITDNLLDVTIRKTNSPDPQISWIMIVGNEQKQDVNVSSLLETLTKYQSELPESVYHSIHVHLTAVQHYEQQEQGEKIVKHMNSFLELLNHQKDKELISEDIYRIFKGKAEVIISAWL